MVNRLILEDIIKNSIKEDLNNGDVTSDNLITDESLSNAVIHSKETGVISGLFVAKKVFEIIDETLQIESFIDEGQKVEKGQPLMRIFGKTKSILKAERLALNFLQRLSGISTYAYKLSSLVSDYDVRVVDTRKTTPGLRILEKYAVRAGGCYNHRYNLSDAVMIKDNHIVAAGGIKEALVKIKQNIPHVTKIEIEIKSLDQLEEAINNGADIVMLDNMTYEDMKKAVEINGDRVILEASGGINEETIVNVAKTGIDVISVGALTHSYDSLDISLNFK